MNAQNLQNLRSVREKPGRHKDEAQRNASGRQLFSQLSRPLLQRGLIKSALPMIDNSVIGLHAPNLTRKPPMANSKILAAPVQARSRVEWIGQRLTDRNVFVMGLYDGMMNEVRNVGQRLPSRSCVTKISKGKKRVMMGSPGLHIHSYTVALNLGKQIRFSAPLEQITAELETVLQQHLTQ